MTEVNLPDRSAAELTDEKILAQLELLTCDDVFRSSKRSIAFLSFVVKETLKGSADQIKERTIGAEVFGRPSSYDTNLDHVVRTAATELRKRLAIYYGDDKHRSELRIYMIPGTYIPKFAHPHEEIHGAGEAEGIAGMLPGPDHGKHLAAEALDESTQKLAIASNFNEHPLRNLFWVLLLTAALLAAASLGYLVFRKSNPEYLFWKPVLDTPGPVLVAVGDVPNGPPTSLDSGGKQDSPLAIQHSNSSRSVPFADMVTIAKVVGVLQSSGKKVVIRRENSSSFSDLREGPVVLIGAFNNDWSLRLTRHLRYTLALDPENHLIYIKDAKNPGSRTWSWGTNQPRENVGGIGTPALHDYALISRIRNSETGHVLIVIGGLYTYGTETAGEFLTDPQLMQSVFQQTRSEAREQSLQIVLGTTVTDGTPGPPKILAVSTE